MKTKSVVLLCLLPIAIAAVLYGLLSPIHLQKERFVLKTPGGASVHVARDEYAVPHITGPTLKDSLYALGYVHATDRLWSMHFRRLIATGRLTEFFGSGALPMDKFIHAVGLPFLAQEEASRLDADTKEQVESYCQGINDYVAAQATLPAEFWMTYTSFYRFTVEDSLAVYKLLSFSLGISWTLELQRTRLAEEIGVEAALEWLPLMSTLENTVTVNEEELKRVGMYDPQMAKKFNETDYASVWKNSARGLLATQIAASHGEDLSDPVHSYIKDEIEKHQSSPKGSNCWVIHGNHTQSGKPLLASDPHLSNSIPSIWHQASIQYGNRTVMGAAISGIPAILIGKTDKLAWGVTNLWGDQTDLYQEEINQDNTAYLYKGEWHPIETRNVTIKSKVGSDYNYTIYSTRHGPILENFSAKQIAVLRYSHEAPKNYSFAWTGAILNDTSYLGYYRAYRSDTVEEFLQSLQLVSASLNIFVASKDNHIAYMSVGRLIKRESFDNLPFVKNGTSGRDEWGGVVEGPELLRIIDPPKGYLHSTNNMIAHKSMRYGLGFEGVFTARSKRLEQLIESRISNGEKINIKDCMAWQFDEKDVYSEIVLQGLIGIVDQRKGLYPELDKVAIDRSLSVLRHWNSSFDSESKGALVFHVWEQLFIEKLFEGKNLTDVEQVGIVDSLLFNSGLFGHFKAWIEDYKTAEDPFCRNHLSQGRKYSCLYLLIQSLEEVQATVSDQLGADEAKWGWGEFHTGRYGHVPFSKSSMSFIFNREVHRGGNSRTLNAAFGLTGSAGRWSRASANYRLVVDLSEGGEAFHSIDAGISERAYSSHYTDQLSLHSQGKYIKLVSPKNHSLE